LNSKFTKMAKKCTINKDEGIIMIADMLYKGERTGAIVQKFTENYKLSVSAVNKWIKIAKNTVKERQEEDEKTKRDIFKQNAEDIAKELGLSLKEVLSEYKKVAFFDIRKLYTVDGGLKSIHDLDDEAVGAIGGVESYDVKEPDSGMVLGTTQKVKIVNKISALDSISKVLGYNAPTKVANTDTDGNNVTPPITESKVDDILSELRKIHGKKK